MRKKKYKRFRAFFEVEIEDETKDKLNLMRNTINLKLNKTDIEMTLICPEFNEDIKVMTLNQLIELKNLIDFEFNRRQEIKVEPKHFTA